MLEFNRHARLVVREIRKRVRRVENCIQIERTNVWRAQRRMSPIVAAAISKSSSILFATTETHASSNTFRSNYVGRPASKSVSKFAHISARKNKFMLENMSKSARKSNLDSYRKTIVNLFENLLRNLNANLLSNLISNLLFHPLSTLLRNLFQNLLRNLQWNYRPCSSRIFDLSWPRVTSRELSGVHPNPQFWTPPTPVQFRSRACCRNSVFGVLSNGGPLILLKPLLRRERTSKCGICNVRRCWICSRMKLAASFRAEQLFSSQTPGCWANVEMAYPSLHILIRISVNE